MTTATLDPSSEAPSSESPSPEAPSPTAQASEPAQGTAAPASEARRHAPPPPERPKLPASAYDIEASGQRIAAGVCGAALVGATLGMGGGPMSSLALAAALPAIWLGVAALTAPALYIGSAFVGVAPAPSRIFGALKRGLADTGLVLLGLAPALLLMSATSGERMARELLSLATIVFGAVLGLWMVYPRLFGPMETSPEADDIIRWRSRGLWVGWSVICLGIGAHMLFRVATAL
ncbi:MAG: hypothetical protein ACE366_15510 [Bradymonadia bacterium]